MFLHGSINDIEVGAILVPGDEIDVNTNGGKSDYVYLVSTDGYSLTECEGGESYDNTFDFAVSEALWWGGDKFIYVVEPLGKLLYDDHHDVSPACVKTNSARVVKKYDAAEYSFDELCDVLKNTEKKGY